MCSIQRWHCLALVNRPSVERCNLNPKIETTHVGTCSLAYEASCGVDFEQDSKQAGKPVYS